MIVQLVIKAIIFYLVFVVIRGFLRGLGQLKHFNDVKNNLKDQVHKASQNSYQNQHSQHNSKQSKGSDPDTVEADFRRL